MFRFRPFSFLMFVLMVIGLAMFWSVLQQRFWSGPAPAGSRRAEQEAQQRAELEKQRTEFVRSEQERAIGLADRAAKDLEKATADAAAWQKDVVPLRENFDGRMIAANAALTKQLFLLFEEERATPEEMATMRGEMEEAVKPFREALANRSSEPIEKSVMVTIENLAAKVKTQAELWSAASAGATAIIRESKRGDQETSDQTLAKSFDKLRDDQALAALQERQEDAAKAEAAEKKRKEKEAADAVAKEEAKAKLRGEVNSPEVKQHLGIFFERRAMQPKGTSGVVKWEKVLDTQATSLSRLESMGALEPSLQGLVILSRIGTRRELSQPRWMFPTEASNWSEENQQFLKTAQELLKRLGPTLVEEGLLSP